MQLIAGLATLSFIVVGGLIGTRLLLLARQTRQVPELSIGLAMILVVFLGYPLALSPAFGALSPDTARLSFTAGIVITAIGQCCIFVFTRAVFRPDAGWARAFVGLAIACIGTLAFINARSILGSTAPLALDRSTTSLASLCVYTVGYLWTAIEAFRYHALLRRRSAFGLADPVVMNRFLLWAVSGTSASIGIAIPITMMLVGDDAMGRHPLAMLALGMAGLASSVSTYLAFNPPAVWIRFVTGHATPRATA